MESAVNDLVRAQLDDASARDSRDWANNGRLEPDVSTSGGKMLSLCDSRLRVPTDVTMHIQGAHLALEHLHCRIVERSYFGPERFAAAKGTVALAG